MRVCFKRKQIIRAVVLFSILCIIFGFCPSSVSADTGDTVIDQEDTSDVAVPCTELDLGEYKSNMMVGESQILNVTVIPVNSTEQALSFLSSDTNVATINGIGRITANSVGITEISVTCGLVTEKFTLYVDEKKVIVAEELDLGNYESKMTIGGTQLLNITVIPLDAADQSLTYSSSDTAVAAINGIGRITVASLGQTVITVYCGNITASFTLTVVENDTEKTIPITKIKVADYEEELKVDETLMLSATIYPIDATEQTIMYTSNNESIATVSSSGEVKGKSSGYVTISISAGGLTKNVQIHVIEPTKQISLNSNFIILKPGVTFSLEASVFPSNASYQTISYKSSEENIATVSEDGVITAVACGTVTIIAFNEDLSAAATVIVNEKDTSSNSGESLVSTVDSNVSSNMNRTSIITTDECPEVNEITLKELYKTGGKLTVLGNGYSITVEGRNIVNYFNKLSTKIVFSKEKDGVSFVLNGGNNLCGTLSLEISDPEINGNHLYIYNAATGKYCLIETENVKNLELDTPGKYLITSREISNSSWNTWILLGGGIVIVGAVIVYIVCKKKHWFW